MSGSPKPPATARKANRRRAQRPRSRQRVHRRTRRVRSRHPARVQLGGTRQARLRRPPSAPVPLRPRIPDHPHDRTTSDRGRQRHVTSTPQPLDRSPATRGFLFPHATSKPEIPTRPTPLTKRKAGAEASSRNADGSDDGRVFSTKIHRGKTEPSAARKRVAGTEDRTRATPRGIESSVSAKEKSTEPLAISESASDRGGFRIQMRFWIVVSHLCRLTHKLLSTGTTNEHSRQ